MNSSSLGTYEQLFRAQDVLKISPIGVREGCLSEVATGIHHSQKGYSLTDSSPFLPVLSIFAFFSLLTGIALDIESLHCFG